MVLNRIDRPRSLLMLVVVVALILLGVGGNFSRPRATSAATDKIIGYIPSWTGAVSDYQLDKLTHATYAFLLPNADGSLKPLENPARLQDLVTRMHARSKKVLISVGGWNNGDDSAFNSISANSTYRTTFANNLASAVSTYGLDGVDIDWEYPDASADNANYYSMVQAIRTKLDAQFGAGVKYLTAAVCAIGSSGCGSNISTSSLGVLNWIMVMAYDGDGGAGHSPYSMAVSSLDYWVTTRGLAPAKVVLGVPFYSRPGWYAWNVLQTGGCSADSDTCVYGGATQYYNGRPTLQNKVQLAKDRGIAGVMIWEITQDTVVDSSSLLKAIYDKVTAAAPAPTATRTATATRTRTNTAVGAATATRTATATATRTNTAVGAATATRTRTPTAAPPPTATTSGAIPAWAPNVSYAVGAKVTYAGLTYQCQQAHTSQVGWEPPNTPALWVKL
jgi:chitinase